MHGYANWRITQLIRCVQSPLWCDRMRHECVHANAVIWAQVFKGLRDVSQRWWHMSQAYDHLVGIGEYSRMVWSVLQSQSSVSLTMDTPELAFSSETWSVFYEVKCNGNPDSKGHRIDID